MTDKYDKYESMDEIDKLKFLADVANMYYNLNMTQIDISKELCTTRFKVAKLLQDAKDMGVIEISIKQPIERNTELENKFKSIYSLKNALILDTKNIYEDEIMSSTCKLAAQYIDSIVTENSIIGITWGKTLFNTIRYIKPKLKLPITAVQVLGSATKDNFHLDSPELVKEMANIYGGTCKVLFSPLYIENDYVRDGLLHEPVISNTLHIASKADIILTGISSKLISHYSTSWLDNEIDSKNFDEPSSQIVGSIFGRAFDENGFFIDNNTNRKVVGLNPFILSNAKHSICITSDLHKSDALLGALKGKLINTIIIDDLTASKILYLDKYK